jgi:hypothetical protein
MVRPTCEARRMAALVDHLCPASGGYGGPLRIRNAGYQGGRDWTLLNGKVGLSSLRVIPHIPSAHLVAYQIR